MGQRVARHLPDTGIHFEFLLYDRPEIQAFSMPGGRIYVSRKMIAFLKNEDELAGVLGHETGHAWRPGSRPWNYHAYSKAYSA